MTYTDPKTGIKLDKGPDDFLSDTNPKTLSDGSENHSFDEKLFDKEWAEWEKYEKTHIPQHGGKDAPPDNDGGGKDVKGYFNSDKHKDERDDKAPGDPEHKFGDDKPFKAPSVPGGDKTPGKGVTKVSTEAIKVFASNIEQLFGPLDEVAKKLQGVKLAPGSLPASFVLKDGIVGSKGLVPASLGFIDRVRDALTEIVKSSRTLAATYQNHEEFNKMSGKDLGEFVGGLRGNINGMKGNTAT
ncbi:hypothetical protein ACQPZF_25980 [Actinosynnema sp. CS-041913]|uniref:hypothetical protein n=1 Tax=Actinosynnema sp. CS-041913 TaxID=3239917 RepID=UPI003D9319DC